MSNYRRADEPGACYFFTVVTHGRYPSFASEERVALLREAFRMTRRERPFVVEAAVILPDHLHCLWRLPTGDADFSGRWREIKKRVSRRLAPAANDRRERAVWQRRFWEHLIRDEQDWRNHLDYIHYNPVRHGLVARAGDWPWSSFRRLVELGWYDPDWGAVEPAQIAGMECE